MKTKTIFYFFITTLFIVTGACSDDNDDMKTSTSSEFQDQIIGLWTDHNSLPVDTGETKSQRLLAFNSDGTFNIKRRELHSETEEILGYRYSSTGEYQLEEKSLLMHETEIYINDDRVGPFSDLDGLEFTDTQVETTVTISFDDTFSLLTFNHNPCGLNENCIEEEVFKRAE